MLGPDRIGNRGDELVISAPCEARVRHRFERSVSVGYLDPIEAGFDAQLGMGERVVELEVEIIAVTAVSQSDINVHVRHRTSRFRPRGGAASHGAAGNFGITFAKKELASPVVLCRFTEFKHTYMNSWRESKHLNMNLEVTSCTLDELLG